MADQAEVLVLVSTDFGILISQAMSRSLTAVISAGVHKEDGWHGIQEPSCFMSFVSV